MAANRLMIIGESINDSVPRTHEMLERGDLDSIVALAQQQDRQGADYIDVNIGPRPPELMAELVRRIQQLSQKPLSIDSPDPRIAEAGLRAYDPERAGGQKPLLNSVSPLRTEMFRLWSIQPFRVILLASEKWEGDRCRPCRTAEETYQAARHLVEEARSTGFALSNDDFIIDPGLVPLATDNEGHLGRVLEAIDRIHNDADLTGVHLVVGLSNLTVMLPSKRADGSPVKGPLQDAFLTKAVPSGLDMAVAAAGKKYRPLPADHPAMTCLEDCLRQPGFDAIRRIRQFYAGR